MTTKFPVVHIKLTETDEAEAKQLVKKIFPYLIMMSGDLETFLGSHGLLTKKKQNSKGFARIFKGNQEPP